MLDADAVDGGDLAVFDDEFQVIGEELGLLPVPVEIHADGDVAQFEGTLGAGMFEVDFVVAVSLEEDAAVLHGGGIGTRISVSAKGVGRFEIKSKCRQRHDADREYFLFAEQFFFHDAGFM